MQNQTREELEKERDRIKAILARRAHKDPAHKGNYITDYKDTGNEMHEVEDDVFEEVLYESDLDIEHVLEKRLKKIDEQLSGKVKNSKTS
jgi:anion-transporting  ArsA/GET3 family ATPase